MKNKLALPLLGAALLLASCGGGGAHVTPPPATPTLHQGVWEWVIVDPYTEDIVDSGTVVYRAEATREGRTVASGSYVNQAKTRQGLSLLGPITASGALETRFTVDTDSNNSTIYFAGQDFDGALGDHEGMATFEGRGSVFGGHDQPSREVYIALLQTSETVPTGAQAVTAAGADARALAQKLGESVNFSADRGNSRTPNLRPGLNGSMRER